MKIILCFIYDGFADFETVLSCTGLSGTEDYEVVYIAYEQTPVISSGGMRIVPDKIVSDISQTNDIDGLIIPRKYTTSQEPKDYKDKNELDPFPRETYVDTRIVQDGNIITAKGFAFIDFALKIWDWYNAYEYVGEREELKAQFTQI